MQSTSRETASGDTEELLKSVSRLARPRQFLVVCVSVLVFLIVMSSLSLMIGGLEKIEDPVRYDQISSILVKAFWVDRERSFPTVFNFSLLVAACSLLFFTARLSFVVGNRWRFHWLILGAVFLLLSFDEAAQIHEGLVDPMRRAFDATGVFFFAWIIPGMAFVAVFALAFLNFLRALPRRIAGMMILGGALYVGGAIGMEMVGGWLAEAGKFNTPIYVAVSTCEESLEMLGITVFCTAVLTLLAAGAQSDQGNVATI